MPGIQCIVCGNTYTKNHSTLSLACVYAASTFVEVMQPTLLAWLWERDLVLNGQSYRKHMDCVTPERL